MPRLRSGALEALEPGPASRTACLAQLCKLNDQAAPTHRQLQAPACQVGPWLYLAYTTTRWTAIWSMILVDGHGRIMGIDKKGTQEGYTGRWTSSI